MERKDTTRRVGADIIRGLEEAVAFERGELNGVTVTRSTIAAGPALTTTHLTRDDAEYDAPLVCQTDELELAQFNLIWTPHRKAASVEGWNLFHVNYAEERVEALVDGKAYGERPIEPQAIDDPDEGAPLTGRSMATRLAASTARPGPDGSRIAQGAVAERVRRHP